MGVLSLERKHKGKNRVQTLVSVFKLHIPGCLTHHKKTSVLNGCFVFCNV